MSILYEDLTWEEIRERIKQDYIAVLPCGCIEQSGPHLPIDVDSWGITHRVREGAERATEKYGVKVLVLPTLYYGPGHEHMGFPGTIRLSFETYIGEAKLY